MAAAVVVGFDDGHFLLAAERQSCQFNPVLLAAECKCTSPPVCSPLTCCAVLCCTVPVLLCHVVLAVPCVSVCSVWTTALKTSATASASQHSSQVPQPAWYSCFGCKWAVYAHGCTLWWQKCCVGRTHIHSCHALDLQQLRMGCLDSTFGGASGGQWLATRQCCTGACHRPFMYIHKVAY
jgi:hypothetical protein